MNKHERQIAELISKHEQAVLELRAGHEQQMADLVNKHEQALKAGHDMLTRSEVAGRRIQDADAGLDTSCSVVLTSTTDSVYVKTRPPSWVRTTHIVC